MNDFRVGGGQKLAVEVLSHLDVKKFEVHLVTLMQFPKQESFYNNLPDHVTVHELHFKNFLDLKELKALIKLLKKINPEIVWSSFFMSNTIFRVVKPVVGYSVVISEQNTYIWKKFFHKTIDHLLSYITYKIVAVSQYVLEFTADQEKISKHKFHLIHNGVDVEKIRSKTTERSRREIIEELGFKPESKIIINVGQFIEQKNQLLLIDAFARFNAAMPEYKLIILGDGVLREDLERRIKELGLEEEIRVPGIKKDIASYYAASEFFVLSSRFEGFPLVVVEALACGLPIVSTPVSGSDEYLKEGENGFIAAETVESLSEAMEKLAKALPDNKERFQNAATTMADVYDIRAITKKYEELFEEAVTIR